MSGTDLAHAICLCWCYMVPSTGTAHVAIGLRACYAMPGIDYGNNVPGRDHCDCWARRSYRGPVSRYIGGPFSAVTHQDALVNGVDEPFRVVRSAITLRTSQVLMVLRCSAITYALPSTDVAYGASLSTYALAMRCPVLS
eukprot:83657-Rhodomonas_salina.3